MGKSGGACHLEDAEDVSLEERILLKYILIIRILRCGVDQAGSG